MEDVIRYNKFPNELVEFSPKVFSRDKHWFMGESSGLKMALYSDNPMDWFEMVQTKTPTDPGQFKTVEQLIGSKVSKSFLTKQYWRV